MINKCEKEKELARVTNWGGGTNGKECVANGGDTMGGVTPWGKGRVFVRKTTHGAASKLTASGEALSARRKRAKKPPSSKEAQRAESRERVLRCEVKP